MLENSVFVDGQQGKELDQLFKKYNELGSQIDDLTTTRKQVSEKIKATCNEARLYETVNYTIRMKSKPATREVIDKDLLRIKYPDIYAEVLKIENIPTGVTMGTPKKK